MNYAVGEPLPEALRLISPGASVSAAGLAVSGHTVTQESAAPKIAEAAPEGPSPQAAPTNPII